jgi:hypothetical protein
MRNGIGSSSAKEQHLMPRDIPGWFSTPPPCPNDNPFSPYLFSGCYRSPERIPLVRCRPDRRMLWTDIGGFSNLVRRSWPFSHRGTWRSRRNLIESYDLSKCSTTGRGRDRRFAGQSGRRLYTERLRAPSLSRNLPVQR